MIRSIKRRTICVILTLLLLILAWFVFINIATYSKISKFRSDINQTYKNIEQEGEKFVFLGDSLVYWSDNTIDIDRYVEDSSALAFLPNGIYLKKTLQKEDSLFLYLYLIKNNFAIQNSYTPNKYNAPFSLKSNITISTNKTSFPISIDNKVVFYLDNVTYSNLMEEWQVFVLDIMVLVCVFITLLMLIRLIEIKKKKPLLNLFILLFIYSLSGMLVYRFSSYCSEPSFFLYNKQIHYTNILFFLLLAAQGYLLFRLTIQISRPSQNRKFALSKRILLLLFISVVYGSVMEMFSYKDIRQKIEKKAKEISQKRSPNAEEQFVKKIEELEGDEHFSKLLKQGRFLQAEDYATNIYFQSIKDKYHVGILVFNDKDSMFVQPIGYYTNILSYTEERINGARRIDSAFVWVEDNEIDNNNTYIYLCKSDSVNIFVECLRKKNSKNMNYSLLFSEQEDEVEGSLSYARYRKKHLVYSFGERSFDYGLKDSNITTNTDNLSFWKDEKGYMSYYLVDKDNVYVVSFFYRLPYNLLGAISRLFLIFIIIFGLDFFIGNSPNFKSITPGIRSSILFALIGSFVVGITIAGFFSIRSINDFNSKYNTDNIRNKTNAIRIEVESFFAGQDIYISNNIHTDLDNLLLNLSNTFLTDINLFDTNMCLLSTSQKSVFEQGFLLDKMNIETKQRLKEHSNTMYIKERIGDLNFQSVYSPITDPANKVICYLNIPFINQQKIMDDNINSIINNFINMFLFWVNISIIIF
ncbi:MAG: hypothetical protein Q4Q06_06175, partial [Bacteroidota bacterium]|nr:hypothetical protein [Bacteroidota bacterium]